MCVRASVHAQAYVNIHNSWPGQLSPRSHWPVPPCKHTPTCYWFILSSTHSTRTAGRREGGSVGGGEGGELWWKSSRSMDGARRCVEYVAASMQRAGVIKYIRLPQLTHFLSSPPPKHSNKPCVTCPAPQSSEKNAYAKYPI